MVHTRILIDDSQNTEISLFFCDIQIQTRYTSSWRSIDIIIVDVLEVQLHELGSKAGFGKRWRNSKAFESCPSISPFTLDRCIGTNDLSEIWMPMVTIDSFICVHRSRGFGSVAPEPFPRRFRVGFYPWWIIRAMKKDEFLEMGEEFRRRQSFEAWLRRIHGLVSCRVGDCKSR